MSGDIILPKSALVKASQPRDLISIVFDVRRRTLIYIYIYDLQLRFVKFDAQAHMWLDTLVTSGSFLYNLSWTFSCPLHCGGDRLSPFLAGFSTGSLFGFFIALWLFVIRISPFPAPSTLSRPSFLPRQQSRLSAYLHE